jgi:hypothetical protein
LEALDVERVPGLEEPGTPKDLIEGMYPARILVHGELICERSFLLRHNFPLKVGPLVLQLPQLEIGISGGAQVVLKNLLGLILVQGLLGLLILRRVLPTILRSITVSGTHTIIASPHNARAHLGVSIRHVKAEFCEQNKNENNNTFFDLGLLF